MALATVGVTVVMTARSKVNSRIDLSGAYDNSCEQNKLDAAAADVRRKVPDGKASFDHLLRIADNNLSQISTALLDLSSLDDIR